jgi:hypothetical protein
MGSPKRLSVRAVSADRVSFAARGLVENKDSREAKKELRASSSLPGPALSRSMLDVRQPMPPCDGRDGARYTAASYYRADLFGAADDRPLVLLDRACRRLI